MKSLKLFAASAVIALLCACSGGGALLPNVSGKAGEIIVVIEKEYWESELGNEVRGLLACECPFLAQPEPLYSLVNVAPGGFADLFKVHRNIVLLNVGAQVDTSAVTYRHNVWAAPQCVVQIGAKTPDEAVQMLKDNGAKIVAAIEQAERDRVIANSIRYEEGEIRREVSAVFGGSPHFPIGYKLRKIGDNFAWIADDKDFSSQIIFIYRYPVLDDEPFAIENIIRHRNEIMKENVPGMREDSYMTTSTFFNPYVEYTRFRGRDFALARGYWEVENDFMGGPFMSQSFYSKDGFDIIVAEAVVYAPKYEKRQYLRQVESIVYSWEWAENNDEKSLSE